MLRTGRTEQQLLCGVRWQLPLTAGLMLRGGAPLIGQAMAVTRTMLRTLHTSATRKNATSTIINNTLTLTLTLTTTTTTPSISQCRCIHTRRTLSTMHPN